MVSLNVSMPSFSPKKNNWLAPRSFELYKNDTTIPTKKSRSHFSCGKGKARDSFLITLFKIKSTIIPKDILFNPTILI